VHFCRVLELLWCGDIGAPYADYVRNGFGGKKRQRGGGRLRPKVEKGFPDEVCLVLSRR